MGGSVCVPVSVCTHVCMHVCTKEKNYQQTMWSATLDSVTQAYETWDGEQIPNF